MTTASKTFTFPVTAPVVGNFLYVDGVNGLDSRTKAQARSASTPWKTIYRAVAGSATGGQTNSSEAAAAGDTVLVSPGIYWETGMANAGRWTVALNPVNSGTASNPITIRGNGGRPDVRLLNGIRGGTIGSIGRNYIVWDNLKMDDTYSGPQSATGFGDGSILLNACTGVQIINCDLYGHNGSYYWGYPTFIQNYSLIFASSAIGSVVRNNKFQRIHDHATGRGTQNSLALIGYSCQDTIFENNTVWNAGGGVDFKGTDNVAIPNIRNIARKNKFYNCHWQAMRAIDATDSQFYQNVVYDSLYDGYAMYAGFFGSTRSRFFNNTIYSSVKGFAAQGTALVDVECRNNLIVSSQFAAHYNFSVGYPNEQDVVYDRNGYFGNTRHWYTEGGVNLTLAQCQAAPYLMDVNGQTLASDPFVNAAARDFRLTAGTSARTLGRDTYGTFGTVNAVIPAGAYVTGAEQIGADW
jgi:hypothetical protein